MNRAAAIAVTAMMTLFISVAPSAAADEVWTDPRCSRLPFEKLGPFLHLSDGRILCIDGNTTTATNDGGKTWSEPRPIAGVPKPGIPGICLAVKEADFVGQ